MTRLEGSPPRCALPSCRVPLDPAPDHPGHEIGTWHTHPGAPHGSLIGHTSASVTPHPANREDTRP